MPLGTLEPDETPQQCLGALRDEQVLAFAQEAERLVEALGELPPGAIGLAGLDDHLLQRGRDDVELLTAHQAPLPRVWVQARHSDARRAPQPARFALMGDAQGR